VCFEKKNAISQFCTEINNSARSDAGNSTNSTRWEAAMSSGASSAPRQELGVSKERLILRLAALMFFHHIKPSIL
jgi:hypothetical protein